MKIKENAIYQSSRNGNYYKVENGEVFWTAHLHDDLQIWHKSRKGLKELEHYDMVYHVMDLPEEKETPVDDACHPQHYKTGGIEPIEIMEAKMNPDQFQGFLMGNILKYVMRHEHKNGLEDLKKAQWYLNKLIQTKEGQK